MGIFMVFPFEDESEKKTKLIYNEQELLPSAQDEIKVCLEKEFDQKNTNENLMNALYTKQFTLCFLMAFLSSCI